MNKGYRLVSMLLLALVLALLATACADSPSSPTKVTVEDITKPGPTGPPVMTIRVLYDGNSTDRVNIWFGGNLRAWLDYKGGLPTPGENDSIMQIRLRNYSCGAVENKITSYANTGWLLNADQTVTRNIRICNKTLSFELEILIRVNGVDTIYYHSFQAQYDELPNNIIVPGSRKIARDPGTGNYRYTVQVQ